LASTRIKKSKVIGYLYNAGKYTNILPPGAVGSTPTGIDDSGNFPPPWRIRPF
jgi:hypothetical protein